MKKIHIILQRVHARKNLERLQDIGLAHIEHQRPLKGSMLDERKEDFDHLSKAVAALKEIKSRGTQQKSGNCTQLVERIMRLLKEINTLKDDVGKRGALITRWEPWGHFDPLDIEKLRYQGVYVKLYERPVKGATEAPKDVAIQSVYEADGIERIVAISREDIKLPYEEVALPQRSLNDLKSIQEKEHDLIAKAQKEIEDSAVYYDHLFECMMHAEDVLQFEETIVGMKEEDRLVVLKGYCPENACKELETYAQKEGWAILIEDPTAEDQVPTLLKNNKLVDLSKPALDVIEIMPGYKEVDVSKVFIIFFTLFFGMLIGDAAYGIIFAGLTLFAQIKLKDKIKDQTAFRLLYLLTGFTVIWGILTGTYFGQQWLPASVNPVVPWLNDPENLQWLCFTVALVHLSIARLWAFKVKLPSITAFAEIGWLLIVWGMYFLANMFVLSMPFPVFAKWFFIIGIPIALIFMVPIKDLLKTLPQEMIPFVLGVIGAGTDIVSYVRLFAVGLATVAVADAANSMPGTELPAGLNYFLFVFLHLLNMVLAAMAILVHAIRLNVLEFSGQLGLEWSGFKYNPFRKKLKQV